MYARTSPLTNNIRVINPRATGLLRQSCCSHCLYQEDRHVCLEQTPCRSLVGIICIHVGIFFFDTAPDSLSGLKIHTTRWMALTYLGLVIWVFVWMINQTRMRGKNV